MIGLFYLAAGLLFLFSPNMWAFFRYQRERRRARGLGPPETLEQVMRRALRVHFRPAISDDAQKLAALHTDVALRLTELYGHGHWSTKTSDKGVLLAIRTSQVFVACQGDEIVATLRLTTKKPWAIDTSYFTRCGRPLYLVGMAVRPDKQRQGLGKRSFEEAVRIARAWPADVIRLDAYDAAAGAGGFYVRCGCTEVGRATYRETPHVYYEYRLTPSNRP